MKGCPAYIRSEWYSFYGELCFKWVPSITRGPLGGPGWTRTNDVSKVTGLQPATLAARLLTHMEFIKTPYIDKFENLVHSQIFECEE